VLNLDPTQLIPEMVVIAVMLLVAFPVHEAAHAFAASASSVAASSCIVNVCAGANVTMNA